MKKSPFLLAMALALGFPLSASTQILVGPTGLPAIPFNSLPILPATEWASSSTILSGNGDSYTFPADIAAGVQAIDQSMIFSPLERVITNTAAGPSEAAQHNITTGFLISASSSVGATVLKATLRNNTPQAISHVQLGYNFGVYISPSGETAPGHQAFFSTNGLPNSWQPIPAFSGLNAAAPVSTTLFVGRWLPNTEIYLLWVDDNSPNNPDGGYTIDSFTSTGVTTTNVTPLPLSVALSSPVNSTVAFPPLTVSANAAGTPAPTSVSFYTNGVLAAIDASFPYSLTYLTLASGTYTIYAVVSNGSTFAYSGTNTVRVRPEFAQYIGGTYTENFNGMGASGMETPFGWYGGINLPASIIDVTADDGSVGASAAVTAWNYGTSGSSERALGMVATGFERDIVLRLRNNTAGSILSFTLFYDGEVWRNYTNPPVVATLMNYVSYDSGATWMSTGPGFNFTQPFPPAFPQGPVNGNNPANQQLNIGGVITPPSPLPPGGVIYFRWQDINDAGTDGGLAVDNVRFTATLANDTCSGAIPLTTGVAFTMSNTNATTAGDPQSCGAQKGVWFSYTSPSNGRLTISSSSSFAFAQIIEVYTSCSAVNAQECGFDSSFDFPVSANTTYFIVVGSAFGESGTFTINTSLCEAPVFQSLSSSSVEQSNGVLVYYQASFSGTPPFTYDFSFSDGFTSSGAIDTVSRFFGPFDPFPTSFTVTARNACGNANGGAPVTTCGTICLSLGTPVTRTGTTGSGSKALAFSSACTTFPANSARWFQITTLPTNGVAYVSTEGSGYNTVLGVFRGSFSSPNALVPVSCSDNISPANANSMVRFETRPGTNYWLVVNLPPNGEQLQMTYGYESSPPLAPLNDACANAIAMTSGSNYVANTINAAFTGDAATSCGTNLARGVWYTFTPGGNGLLNLSTCGSDFDTVLQVYVGSCASPTLISCNDSNGPFCSGNAASLSLTVTNTTYRILATGAQGTAGTLNIVANFFPQPPNDACAGAIPLANGVPYSMNTLGATTTGDPTPTCGAGFGRGVWFTYTPTVNGKASINACGSDFNTSMTVYNNACGATPVALDCNDNSCGLQSTVVFETTAFTTYRILVGGVNAAGGTLNIVADFCTAPANDQCNGATAMSFGQPYSVNTTCATSAGEATTCGTVTKGVWYQVMPPSSGTITIDTCGSDFATALQVFAGSCGASPSPCNTSGSICGGQRASLTFSVSGSTTYWILVGGRTAASVGNVGIIATFCPTPTFQRIDISTVNEPNGVRVYYTAQFAGTDSSPTYTWSFTPTFPNSFTAQTVSRLFGPFEAYPTSVDVSVQNRCGPGGNGTGGGAPSCGTICLSVGTPQTRSGTDGSGLNSGSSFPCGIAGTSGRWFRLTTLSNAVAWATVSTEGSSYITTIGAFTGSFSSSNNLVPLDCNPSGTSNSVVRFETRPGSNYWIVVNPPPVGRELKLNYGYEVKVASLNYTNSDRVLEVQSAPLPSLPYRYQLQISTNLSSNPAAWFPKLTNSFNLNSPASNNILRYRDTNQPGSDRRFYRILPLP